MHRQTLSACLKNSSCRWTGPALIDVGTVPMTSSLEARGCIAYGWWTAVSVAQGTAMRHWHVGADAVETRAANVALSKECDRGPPQSRAGVPVGIRASELPETRTAARASGPQAVATRWQCLREARR